MDIRRHDRNLLPLRSSLVCTCVWLGSRLDGDMARRYRLVRIEAVRVTTIYKICGRPAWQAAEAAGVFGGSADDTRDGFIHFSTAAQLAETAAKHFAGQADLVLVAVDAEQLGPPLRWEPSRGGALFPHLYAPLPLAAVRWVRRLADEIDGHRPLPELEPELQS
jgi:uncharacterized protein (DUF952 family)